MAKDTEMNKKGLSIAERNGQRLDGASASDRDELHPFNMKYNNFLCAIVIQYRLSSWLHFASATIRAILLVLGRRAPRGGVLVFTRLNQ